MKLFADEDLSPTLIEIAYEHGLDATGSRDRGLLGASDRRIAEVCFDEDRVIVTNNARHFLALYAPRDAHAGLILLPSVPRIRQQELFVAAIEHATASAERSDTDSGAFMVNRVIEVDPDGSVSDYDFPS